GPGPAGRLLRVARDAARKAMVPGRPPRVAVALRRVPGFGPEIAPILDDARRRVVLTARSPGRLGHALRFPRPGLSGWLVEAAGTGGSPGTRRSTSRLLNRIMLIPNKREFLARRLGELGVVRLLEGAARRPSVLVATFHRIGEPGAGPFYEGVYSASPGAFRE